MRSAPFATLAAVVVPSLLALACAAPAPETPAGDQPSGAEPPPTIRDPAALGSTGYLTWEDISVRMVGQSGPETGLRIDVTTLHPDAVRLASDDIRSLLNDHRTRIADRVTGPDADRLTAFLVGYTGFEKEVSFDPTRLQIRSEGSTYYARHVLPLSPRFDSRLVGLYETVYGIYLFQEGLDLVATLEFQYGEMSSGGAWRDVVRRVQRAKTQRESDRG